MPIPRPNVPVLIVKGTNRVLTVLHGDDVYISETPVMEIVDVDTGCLSEPEATVDAELQDLDGVDVGIATITESGKIVWAE